MNDFGSDILAQILSRLPIQSLCRFRCVSKRWCNLIFDYKILQDGHKISGFYDPYGGFFALGKPGAAPSSHRRSVIMASSNEHILFAQRQGFNLRFYVRNPTTGEYLHIEDPINPIRLKSNMLVGLANRKFPHFRVVLIYPIPTEYEFFTYSSGTRSWTQTKYIPPLRDLQIYQGHGIYFNGNLYWLCNGGIILKYNVFNQNFRVVDVACNITKGYCNLLAQCNGHIYGYIYLIQHRLGQIRIWRREYYLWSGQHGWFLLHDASLTPALIADCDVESDHLRQLHPCGFDGNCVLFVTPQEKILPYHIRDSRMELIMSSRCEETNNCYTNSPCRLCEEAITPYPNSSWCYVASTVNVVSNPWLIS